jgi:hypothetical protein
LSRKVKIIGTMVFAVIATAIGTYYCWQYIFSLPMLKSPLSKSIIAISVVTIIVVSEIFTVVLVWHHVKKQKQITDWQKTQVLANLQALPARYSPVPLLNAPLDTTHMPQPRGLTLRSFLLSSFILIVLVLVLVAIVYQSQGGTTTYLPIYASPTLSDTLRQPGQWYESNRDFSGGNCQFSDATFHVRETQSQNVFLCPSTSTYSDFAFEVQMSVIQGDCGGVDVRSDTVNGTGYIFSVCQDGTYTLMRDISPEKPITLLPASHTSAIQTGLNQSNLIAIAIQGHDIKLYVNRQLMKNVQDESYAAGHIAFLALSKDSSTEVTYANAKLWKL